MLGCLQCTAVQFELLPITHLFLICSFVRNAFDYRSAINESLARGQSGYQMMVFLLASRRPCLFTLHSSTCFMTFCNLHVVISLLFNFVVWCNIRATQIILAIYYMPGHLGQMSSACNVLSTGFAGLLVKWGVMRDFSTAQVFVERLRRGRSRTTVALIDILTSSLPNTVLFSSPS